MPSHKAVHVKSAGAPLELAEVETTPPARGEVRISVGACGICGTDAHFVSGDFPGLSWPLTLGHEIAGKIAEIGPGVEDFAVGDRVAVGWFGGNCNHCAQCRKGLFIHCVNGKVPRLALPRRLRRIGDRAGHRAGPHPRGTLRRGSRSDGLRRCDDLQRAAPHQRVAG